MKSRVKTLRSGSALTPAGSGMNKAGAFVGFCYLPFQPRG